MKIEPAPNAPEGQVTRLADFTPASLVAGSAVLCRNNAPLIALLFRCVRAGRSCQMLGKDLEARLQKLLRERRASSVPDLVDRCHKYLATQEQKLSARRFAALSDRVACLLTLTRDAKSVSEVKQRITDIFAPTDASLTFSTIHRAKGMEWDTVYFLDKHLLPSVFATTEADLQQERNLHYVAATRARLNLYFITSK